jgi:ribosome biogenesis ATPase
LKALAGKIKLGPDVDLDAIGLSKSAEGYSGADCAALLREAGLAALKQDALCPCASIETLCITAQHFDYAFIHVVPSVSKKDQSRYDRMRDRMARARTRGGVGDSNELVPAVVPSAEDSNFSIIE